jgi:thiol-disulfide isomerase/thioredoxin
MGVIRFVRNPDPAPPFQLNDLNGKPITLDEAKGKIVLLNFWATWCGPCRAEIPDLIEIQKKYSTQLQIIALATDEDDPDEVANFVRKSGINYRVGMATDAIRTSYGGIPALPTSFIIDAQGRVVQKHVGLNNPAIYEVELRALLGEPVDAKVEYFDDTGEVFLSHADRATELPGVDMSKLTADQKKVALKRLNSHSCTCGCALTLAQCRINDSACEISRGMAAKIVAQVSGAAGKANPASKQQEPVKTPQR